MIKKIFFTALPALLFFLYSFQYRPSDDKDGIEKIRNKEITSEEIFQHIKYLSSDEMEGRFPGTKGDEMTDSYISNEFKKYKLKPFGEKGYLQPFDMFTEVKLSGMNSFQTETAGIENSYTIDNDFIPYGFSGNGEASGKLFFAGYGISDADQNYDDYKDKNGNAIDVSGKILLMMKYSPGGSSPHDNPFQKYEAARIKVAKAREHNAAAVIFFSGPNDGEDKLTKLGFDNVAQNGGIPVVNCRREIIEKLFTENSLNLLSVQNEIDSVKSSNSFELKNSTAKIITNVEPVKALTNNVIGVIEGNDPVLKNEYIVIGAHKDHLGYGQYGSMYQGADKQIHNGADDNASGIAGVLEIAQKISSSKTNLKRSVMFICFGAEEAGLLGSAYFVKSKIFENINIAAMLNMDMVGRLTDEKIVVYGTGTSPVWDPVLDSLNRTFIFSMTKTPDGFGPSDHSSFYQKNIPVLHFFSGTHTDYHSPSDDLEKINSEGEAKILNLVFDVAMVLDEMPAKPEFTKTVSSSNENKSMGSVKVYVGTIPDYSANVEGMKLAGVKEGSPADKGGMKAEDIIVKFGNTEVKNIYDYMYAMAEFKPGDEAEVIVIRNNEKVQLKVTLGAR
ncbi:MAG: M20/M25/M40 family metallo-hydrolase [bacterium]|nr:M20/M25/M40 family metallo-hydrolase [bacterium]